ncbi:MAG: ATP-binding cassette domain-containing protein [Lachnospiraceae bacterium]|nr:ATP-binding cassette domain-containing protein [Lachnospiraceae bacterium]
MKNVIQIENLTKCFGETKVLDNVNVSFKEGKIYGIIGRNGSGKSMLMKCICGLVVPTSGKIIINEKRMGFDIDLPENLSGIIEEPGFLENYSAFKNLHFLTMIRNKIGKEEIISSLKKAGLDPYSKLHVGKYSMGMKQRLGIAQAIMEKPQILILDEPMNGLDHDGVEEMRALFLDLRKEGTLIILASHNKDDVEILCDEVYEMDKGVLTKSVVYPISRYGQS